MPLGWERLNVKRTSPNKNIVFMKPRPGPDESTSQDFLERIAAQCLPIMNKHHLAVVSLEEYEPNREFWGMVIIQFNRRVLNYHRKELQQWRGNPACPQIRIYWSLAAIQVRTDGHDARVGTYPPNESF